jgi:16S rRNA (uracil1498-N3)-methyltransferase
MGSVMADQGGKIRLFVKPDLTSGADIELTREHAHYLYTVMRQRRGARLGAFNGRNGEWAAEVGDISKTAGTLHVVEQTALQRVPPDLWLLFAPIKKSRTDFIVEKAAELGCARIQPVFTRFTNSERLRLDRLQAHVIEAAEQCGETYVAPVDPPVKLTDLLSGWNPARRLMFCDESRAARPAHIALNELEPGPWAILIGPEGGFAPEEAERLRGLPFVLPVTLGPRVLRADTAAVAAMSLWQAALGDWQ